MRPHIGAAALALALVGASCGGSGGSSSTSPSPTPSPGQTALTVTIVGDLGNRSFNPNPASPEGARTVAWRNNDGQVHRIVANDNSFDTGDIGVNGTSVMVTVPAGGISYHCSIHPGMIGTINDSGGNTPPCTGAYC